MIPAQPLPVMQKAALAVELGICNDGQIVLQTHPVREPPQGKGGADEVAELSGSVIGRGVVVNVVVNMTLVYVSANEELIFSLCPAHRCFVADAVGLLHRHLALRERLTDLVAQRTALGLAVCFTLILIFHHHKLGVRRGGIA